MAQLGNHTEQELVSVVVGGNEALPQDLRKAFQGPTQGRPWHGLVYSGGNSSCPYGFPTSP